MAAVPQWHATGDWFDVCSCNIPCPCEFAQPPTNNVCDGALAWRIREGTYADVPLDGLSVLALGHIEGGNIWTGEAKVAMGLFLDERADERQREALQMIFGGQAGGWPAGFAQLITDLRGVETAQITFELADATWPTGASRSRAKWRPAPRPSVDRRHRRASGFKRSTRRGARWVRARLLRGARPLRPTAMPSASGSISSASRASISPSTGVVRARRARERGS